MSLTIIKTDNLTYQQNQELNRLDIDTSQIDTFYFRPDGSIADYSSEDRDSDYFVHTFVDRSEKEYYGNKVDTSDKCFRDDHSLSCPCRN